MNIISLFCLISLNYVIIIMIYVVQCLFVSPTELNEPHSQARWIVWFFYYVDQGKQPASPIGRLGFLIKFGSSGAYYKGVRK